MYLPEEAILMMSIPESQKEEAIKQEPNVSLDQYILERYLSARSGRSPIAVQESTTPS